MLMPATSEQYRCDLNSVDWNNCVVVLGCSHTWGTGLEPEETYCAQLENILQKPVYNLGMPGTGIDYVTNNAVRLYKRLHAAQLIIQYPDSGRCFYWHEKHAITNLTPQTVPSDLGSVLMSKAHTIQTTAFYRSVIQALYPRAIEFTFTIDDSIEFNIPQAPVDDACDRARDGMHFGPDTHRKIATWLSHRFNL